MWSPLEVYLFLLYIFGKERKMLTPEDPSCPESIVEREPHEKKKENGICTKKSPAWGRGKSS